MKGSEFHEMVRSGIKPVVTFTKQIEDQEGYAEGGMRAHVLSSEVRHDDVCHLLVSYAAFDEFNKQFESANYYDRDGQATLTARQKGSYQVEETLYIDANHEVPFNIENTGAIALYESFTTSKQDEQSYVAWLEAKLLAQKPAVPEGWIPVPVDAPLEMLEEIWIDSAFTLQAIRTRYRGMLAKVPAHP